MPVEIIKYTNTLAFCRGIYLSIFSKAPKPIFQPNDMMPMCNEITRKPNQFSLNILLRSIGLDCIYKVNLIHWIIL